MRWLRFHLAVTLAAAAVACSSTPSTPTPPPPPVDPGAPKITCPAAVTAASPGGGAVAVAYAAPTVTGGFLPLTGPACTPASNSLFKPGSSTVSCTVTDARQRTDPCTFTVTVTLPPTLVATRFLAFGDSMTWGEDGRNFAFLPFTQGAPRPSVRFPIVQTYPGALEVDLHERYTTQSPSVTNAGLVQEAVTGSGTFSRYQSLTSSGQYDAVLIMDGANDLADRDAAIEDQVIAVLRRMLEDAKGRGMRPMLATLPPQNPNGCCPNRGLAWSLVPGYNDRLRLLATTEAVPLVDVYAAFNGDITTLVGADGLHPTAAGYQVIADTFFAAIRQNLETRATARATVRR